MTTIPLKNAVIVFESFFTCPVAAFAAQEIKCTLKLRVREDAYPQLPTCAAFAAKSKLRDILKLDGISVKHHSLRWASRPNGGFFSIQS